MPVIAVMNPKGGVGKTTLATNLAGYLAASSRSTMLGDIDRQQSAKAWLQLRPTGAPQIATWEMVSGAARPPKGVSHVVIDTPAQIDRKRIAEVVRIADRVLVPLQPSMFDIIATKEFLDELRRHYTNGKRFEDHVGIVGMRLDPRTKAAEELGRFVASLGLPIAGYLRDTQYYVHLAAHGLTMFDVPADRVEKDRATWEPLLGWLRVH
ncbi:MAG TPA: ParA family protein [Burkholderiaceae bacterium]|jgi:chromosome partitioning protein|nr:ParA family protein [Burkholderiaceae bacterium]